MADQRFARRDRQLVNAERMVAAATVKARIARVRLEVTIRAARFLQPMPYEFFERVETIAQLDDEKEPPA